MNWDEVLQDPDFKAAKPEDKYAVAETYFTNFVETDPEFELAPMKDRLQARKNLFATFGEKPDRAGSVVDMLREGVANVGGIPAGAIRLASLLVPTEEQLEKNKGLQNLYYNSQEDWQGAADWVQSQFDKVRPRFGARGEYTEDIKFSETLNVTDPHSILNPARATKTVLENLPQLAAYIFLPGGKTEAEVKELVAAGKLAAGTLSKFIAKRKGLSYLAMAAAEGGDAVKSIQDYEQSTGEKVPEVWKRTMPFVVGLVNAELENLGLETILGRGLAKNTAGKMAKTLIGVGAEGGEEFLQRGMQILGQAGYKDVGSAKQVLGEMFEAFYGGALLGGVIAGPKQLFTPSETTVKPEKLKEEDMPAGLTTEVPTGLTPEVTSRLAGLRYTASKSKGSKQERAQIAKEIEDISTLYAQQTGDVDGTKISAYIDALGVKAKKVPKPTDPFKIFLPHDMSVETTITSGRVKLETVQRISTALSWFTTIAPQTVAKIKALKIVSGNKEAWLSAIAGHKFSGVDFKTWSAVEPDEARTFADEWKKAGSVFFNDGTVLIREGEDVKTEAYVNYFGHEGKHAELQDLYGKDLNTKLSRQEQEKLAEAAGLELMNRFRKTAGNLNFQKVEKDESLIDLSSGVITARESGDTVMENVLEQRIDQHANKAIEANKMNASLEYQAQPAGDRASAAEVIRLLNSTNVFTKVLQADKQLYNDVGDKVFAAVDTQSGALYLSPQIKYNTVGHEIAELVIARLGWDHAIVAKGLEMFKGDKEALSDAIGNYYANKVLDANMIQRIGMWLQELLAAFKAQFGMELSQKEIIQVLNASATQTQVRGLQTWQAVKPSKQLVNSVLAKANTMPISRAALDIGITRAELKARIQMADTEEELHDIITRITGSKDVADDALQFQRAKRSRLKEAKEDADYAGNINMSLNTWSEDVRNANRDLIAEYAANSEGYSDDEATRDAMPILANRAALDKIAARVRAGELITRAEHAALLMAFDTIGVRRWAAMKAFSETGQGQTDVDIITEQMQRWTVASHMIREESGWRLRAVNIFGRRALTVAEQDALWNESTPKQRQIIMQGLLEGKPAQAIKGELKAPKLWEYLFTSMYSGLLSGAANVTNFVSDAIWMSWLFTGHNVALAAADRMVQSPLGKALHIQMNPNQRTAMIKDVATSWQGALKGLPTAVQRLGEAWRTGMIPEALRIKDERGMGFKDMGMAKNPFAHPMAPAIFTKPLFHTKYGDVTIASVFGAPFKSMMVVDVFFRSIAMDSYINSYREREAAIRGVKVSDIPITEEVLQAAHAFGAHAVFMDPPGRFTRAAYSLRETVPFGMGRAVIPFINTISNLLKRGVERLPVVGMGAMTTDMRAGNWTKVLAAQIEGAVATFILLGLFDPDNLTGAPPEDPEERDAFFRQGKQAYSFKCGDSWVSYRRLDPFNIVISNIVAFRDTLNRDAQVDELTLTERFANLAYAVSSNITQSSFADNMLTILTDEGKLSNWLNRLPSSFVPYNALWRTLNASVEAQQLGGRKYDEQSTMVSLIADSLPFGAQLASGLNLEMPPARLNAFGEEVMLPGGALQQWLPVKWRQETNDPVELELAELGIYPGLPSRSRMINGRAFKLDDKMYWEYTQAYGAASKAAISTVMHRPTFARLDDERRRKLIYRSLDSARAKVQKKLDLQLRRLFREEALGTSRNMQE